MFFAAQQQPLAAQDPVAARAAFSAGDIAASGFSGATLQVDKLKPGVDPVMKTVIDADGVTLRIYSGASLDGVMSGQEITPGAIDFKAREIGHVFGLAFGTRPASDTVQPALYAAATSAFGLHIVGADQDKDGKPDRLLKGAPGATFAEGLFGAAGGGPGTIWKIDQATGKLALFADVASKGLKNGGAGLGALAIDAASGMLYVTDLDTGLIHRFNTTGKPDDLGQFDHGMTARLAGGKTAIKDDGQRADITAPGFDTTDDKTWGFTQRERRVDALAVHQARLFYSVADGPEIWSVGLESDGGFKADARFETKIKSDTGFLITSLAFDSEGHMIVAERGAQKNPANFSGFAAPGPARVLRFKPKLPEDPDTAGHWIAVPDEYAIGNAKEHRDSNGGVAIQHRYGADGAIDLNVCGGTLVASASALGPQREIHGLQLNPVERIRTGDELASDHVFINFEPALNDATAHGYAGGVAVLQNCGGGSDLPPVTSDADPGNGSALPPVASNGGFTFPPVTDDSGLAEPNGGGGGGKAALTVTKTAGVDKCSPKGGCVFNIEVRNDTAEAIAGPIVLDEQIGAAQATLTGEPNAPWSCSKAAPFSCTHPGPVPAGGKLDMRVVFAPNTPPEITTVTNCVSIAGPDGQPAPVDAALPQTQCATIPIDPNAPVQTGPVIVSKKGAGTCTAAGPCPFTITLQNTLDTNTGEFLINEVIDAPQATLVGEPNAPWTCTKTAPFSCKHPGLPAKSTTELQLSFAPNTPPEKTELKNCAVPTTFTGGKTQNAPAKQIAPGKKTDLFELKRGFKAFIEPATFRPQSFARDRGLLHLSGGGNIGGVTNKCLEWRTDRNGFVVKQANGFEVSFSDMVIENQRITGGNASYMTSNGPKAGKITGGNVFGKATDGSFAGAMAFGVRWNDGTEGSYSIWLDDQGKVTGHTVDASKNPTKLTADSKWFKCARNEACDSYAKGAADVAAKFNKLSCGPDEPPGRWSNDANFHLDWCMAQPPASTSLNSESVARTDGLAKCQADRAAFCGGYVADALVLAKEFEARKCTEPHAGLMSTDAAAQQKACLEDSRGNLDSAAQSRKILLDSCIARLANAAGAGGAGGAPPEQGGNAGQGEVVPANPAPEQCAIVPISPDGGAVDPAVPPPAVPPPGAPPAEVPPPAPAAAEPNGLVIVKRRAVDKCSDLGGGCAFFVSITNSSANEFNGPIEFTDIFKTADGKPLPNAALEGQPLVTVDEGVVAAISCAKSGENITCGTGGANAKIPAGKVLTAKLTLKPGAAGGATAVRNCVQLKSGGEDSCSNIALINGPMVRLTKFGGGDTCLPKCTFAVVIQNIGNTDASGSFKFKDTFTPASSLGGYNTAPDGTDCSELNGSIFCTPKIRVLKPGELISVPITVFGKAKAAEYKNCVEFVPQPQAPPGQLALDNSNDGRCVTVKDTSPHTPNLVIRKRAPNTAGGADGHCDLKSACRFTIEVTNNGLAPFTGPLRVTDTVSLGVPQLIAIGPGSPQSLPWTCSRVQNGVGAPIAQSSITCELPPLPNGLAPGTTATLEVAVTPGATWKGSDTLKNCAEITSDGDIGANAIKADCASVVLDPFNVKVAKTGDQSCPPGSDCTFKITLFNPGPIPHNAPVTITDGLRPSVSAQIVSISPPLPCATQPATIPFSCTSPGPVRLDLDAPAGSEFGPREFTMVVKMPSDGSAESYRNCVSVSGSDGAAGEEACHTVATKPAATPAAPPVTEPAECSNGMVLTNGECACPPSLRWNGRECVGTGGINLTPQPSGPAATPGAAPATATCLGGMVLTDGACACPPSMRWDKSKCVGTGGSNTTAPNDEKDEVRPPLKRPQEKPSISCPRNSELRRGECVCQRGFESVRGQCRPVKAAPPAAPQKQTCPPNRPVGEFPRCCPENAQFRGGECRCLPGLQLRRGQCVAAQPAPRPQQQTCPQGQIFINGQCRRLTVPTPPKPNPPQQKCPGGYTGTPPNCQPPKIVYPPCPQGWSGTPGNCRPPANKPSPPPAPSPQQPQKCANGFSGFKPNCTCSGRKEVVNGQCIPKIQ